MKASTVLALNLVSLPSNRMWVAAQNAERNSSRFDWNSLGISLSFNRGTLIASFGLIDNDRALFSQPQGETSGKIRLLLAETTRSSFLALIQPRCESSLLAAAICFPSTSFLQWEGNFWIFTVVDNTFENYSIFLQQNCTFERDEQIC